MGIGMRRMRDGLHRKAIKSGNKEDWIKYKQVRNKTNSMLRSAKGSYIAQLSARIKDGSSGDMLAIYHLIGKIISLHMAQTDLQMLIMTIFYLYHRR